MKSKKNHRVPKILKINRVEKALLKISVLFSTGEDRILDFGEIFKNKWKVTKKDHEYKLLQPNEFAKVTLANYTLSWRNASVPITGRDGKKKKVPFEVGADTLYNLSNTDEKSSVSIGSMVKKERLAARLSQEKVAELSGTSRTYITRLESNKSDVELGTLKKIVEAGLNKKLRILIQ